MKAKRMPSTMRAIGRAAAAILYAASLLMPWALRRRLLVTVFGYAIHPTAFIGRSWIMPKHLVMGESALIHHFTVCRHIDLLEMGDHAVIGRGNWITGYPSDQTRHYAIQADRFPALILGSHSAITCRHLIDCTNTITVGRFSTVAGYQSQLMTHSVDVEESIQTSTPIAIGDYCFLGTNCVVLGGASLPSHSVLGAKGLLNKAYSTPYRLYAGVPAVPVKELDAESTKYFVRKVGFIE